MTPRCGATPHGTGVLSRNGLRLSRRIWRDAATLVALLACLSAPAARASVYQWLGIVSSDLGPAYSGQFAFKVMAPEKLPWAIEFYDRLCTRLLATLELQLGRTPFLAGEEYTIADVIAYPAATVSTLRYPGNLDGHPNLKRWAERIGSRPAVQRGYKVPKDVGEIPMP